MGLTATSGDGLTDFGCGEGLQYFCILTVKKRVTTLNYIDKKYQLFYS